jgi:predicted enzyme related to lactoylglutathione lyase
VLLLLLGIVSGNAGSEPVLPPLTTVSGNPRLPGKFVWADLVTDDVAAARKFYAGLFGWTFRDVGGYAIAANDERPVCGMFQRPRPANRPDARPQWFGYLSVGNVGRAQKVVIRAGGRVIAPPVTYPDRGEQAVFADPEGAVFGVIKSASGDPEDFLAEPGDWIWAQLFSRDVRKAGAFYREIAGYELVENAAEGRLSDLVLTSKGFARATVRAIPPAKEKIAPGWLPFVRVNNVAESVALARKLGGKALLEPRPDRFEGRVAVVADPTGAPVGILEWSPEVPKGGR